MIRALPRPLIQPSSYIIRPTNLQLYRSWTMGRWTRRQYIQVSRAKDGGVAASDLLRCFVAVIVVIGVVVVVDIYAPICRRDERGGDVRRRRSGP